MSTKYNRNNANAADDKFYLNDYRTDLNGVEKDDREQTKDFELLPCIVSGLGLTPSAYPSTNVTVAPGIARDKDGKRIQLATSQLAQITDTVGGNNYVILSHKDSTDTPRKAYNTGNEYDTREYDDFELTVASTYNQDDIVLGNVKVEGSENVLYTEERTPDVAKPTRKEPSPPVPTHLDLETNWDDVFRITGASAGTVSFRPAYIKAEFGDKGTGVAIGIIFTKTSNRIGDWDLNEWIGYYLTCADGNYWKVVSNTNNYLTLESGAVPVNGTFHLGPNAAGYKFLIQTLNAVTQVVEATAEAESESMESAVKMETIWHGLFPDVKYRVKVASKGGYFQEEWSDFCSPEEVIAGGEKEIPEACGDILDGDPIITAEDDGIRISWAVKALYQGKVSGFEICWTDDGTSNPDFDNKNHRKVFTDRNCVVLPAKMSSDDITVTVKSKLRAVDKAGRHCVTPKSLDDKNAKKYPVDLIDIVEDYKNIIDAGSFGTLEDFLKQSINMGDGRPKMVSEIESEMADARGTYATVGARIAAILGGVLDWRYVRIVAKGGGQYGTIQAALNSINTPDFHQILIMPDGDGNYSEDAVIQDNTVVGFLGIGDVRIVGSLSYTGSGECRYLGNLNLYNEIQDKLVLNILVRGKIYRPVVIENIIVYQNNGTSGDAAKISIYSDARILMRNAYFKASKGNGLTFAEDPSTAQLKVEMNACGFDTYDECIDVNLPPALVYLRLWDTFLKAGTGATYSITKTAATLFNLYMAHCRYNKLPDEANINEDYGTIQAGKVSNVEYDDADLEVLI